MVNDQNKNKKNNNMSKIQNMKFGNSLVERDPRSIHDFEGEKLMSTFRGDVVWNFYSHIIPC